MTIIPGLNQSQSQVYQAALELGEATVQQIAKKADIPRSTTYLVLDELIGLGLVSTTKQGQKTYLIAEAPQKLMRLLESRELELKQSKQSLSGIMPQLEAIENQQQDKPLVKFYKGYEGIKSIFEYSLTAKEILVLCSGYQHPQNEQFFRYMHKEYLPETDKLKIKTREVITHDPDSDEYVNSYGSDLHDIRYSPYPPAEKHIDKLIFGNTVAIIAFDTMTGTIIQHQDIANFERSQFEQLWKHADK